MNGKLLLLLFWKYLSLQFCRWWMSALSPICFSEVFLIWLRSFSKLITSRVPSSIALRFFLRVDFLHWFSKLNLGYLQAFCSLLLILVLSALFDNQWSVERQFLRPRLVWILFTMTPYQDYYSMFKNLKSRQTIGTLDSPWLKIYRSQLYRITDVYTKNI